jgi:Gas vesicle protein
MMHTNTDDANIMEILDRVLDHGIVVAPSARMYLLGVDLAHAPEHVVVDSITTYG